MEKLHLQNRKGQNIVGNLEKPEGEVSGTAVILHGYGGFKEQPHMVAAKNAFLNNGFVTFNFDATNSFNESDGEYEKATLGLHYEDLEDVCKWVEEQDWFVGPLAITGHSMGGYAVARYAEDYPEEVAICIPLAPVVSGKLSWEAKERFYPGRIEQWRETGWFERVSSSEPDRIKRSPWSHMEERLNHDLLLNANRLTMPVLLYVGTKDDSIPPDHVQILYDAIPGNKKKIVIAEGAPHTYRTESDIKHLYDTMFHWIKDIS